MNMIGSPTAPMPRRWKAPGVAFAALSLVIIGALLNGALVDRYDEDAAVLGGSGSIGQRELSVRKNRGHNKAHIQQRKRLLVEQQSQLQNEQQSPSPLDDAEDDSYIVLVSSSHGFFDMYVNWLKFFQNLAIPNLPVHLFSEDEVTYDKCLEQVASSEYESVDLTCLPWDFVYDHGEVEDQDSGAAAKYQSKKYTSIVSRRPAIVKRELELGRNVLYSDIDIVWLKDPMPFIRDEFRRLDNDGTGKGETNIVAQDDYRFSKHQDSLCTGFVAYKARPATIAFVDLWKQKLESHPGLNQGPFNKLVESTGLRAEILPQELFAGGNVYFEHMTDEQRKEVITAHNNWIIGYDNKVNRFKEFGLWLVE